MLVSIIITSYNYGRFLRVAIDSALNQTYLETEVVVVDDGSDDESRSIIESYGKSVVSVFKENGGHSSAINAGFAVCHGDIVCPLDSDDVFATNKVACVVDAWRSCPEATLVYHQLQTVDAETVPKGRPWPIATWHGDIRRKIKHTGGWWPRPTTSGLCFSRSYLERVLPMPTGLRIWPDTYLAPPAALLGPVLGLNVALGVYRVHGDNTISKYFPESREQSQRVATGQSQTDQYLMEHRLLTDCLEQLLDAPPRITLEWHPDMRRAQRAAGFPVSLWDIALVVAACPSIPPIMKPRYLLTQVLHAI